MVLVVGASGWRLACMRAGVVDGVNRKLDIITA